MFILHLYHPSGPCHRLVFHSRVAARKEAQSWLRQHFPDRVEECLRDIMAETDYFNPVFLAEVPDIEEQARYIIRLGESTVHYPASETEAWRLVDTYALSQHFPTNYLKKLHEFLTSYGYEEKLKILMYPIEWGD